MTAPAPTSAKSSLVEDLVDIIYTPATVFARRANGGFWGMLLLAAVIIAALFFVSQGALQSITDAEWVKASAKMLERNPQMTPDALATARRFSSIFAPVTILFVIAISILAVGLSTWLAAKFVDARLTFKAAAMIAAFAYVPRMFEWLVYVAQGFLLDTSTMTERTDVQLSVARFFDGAAVGPAVLGALSRLDLFVLWGTILIGIGVSVVGKVPRVKGYIAAAIVWLVGAVPIIMGMISAG